MSTKNVPRVKEEIIEVVRMIPVGGQCPDLEEIVNGGEVDECNGGALSSYGGRSPSH